MENLSKKDQEFAKQVALTGNQTKSAKIAYGIESDDYAGKKGSLKVREGKINTAIQEVKKSLADRISNDTLEEVLTDGLKAYTGVGDDVRPDFAVRHKYLDTALKIKGEYETDEDKKSINILMPVLVKFLNNKDERSDN